MKERARVGSRESPPVLSQTIEEAFKKANGSIEDLYRLGGVVLRHVDRDRRGMSELYQSLVLGALRLRTVVGDVRETVEGAMPPVAGEIVLKRTSVPRPLVIFSEEPSVVSPEVTLPDEVEDLFAERSVVGIEAFRIIWKVTDPTIYKRMEAMARKAGIKLKQDERGRNKYQFTREEVLRILDQFEKGSEEKRRAAVELKSVSLDESEDESEAMDEELDEEGYTGGHVWETD